MYKCRKLYNHIVNFYFITKLCMKWKFMRPYFDMWQKDKWEFITNSSNT